MYKLFKDVNVNPIVAVIRSHDNACIPFAPANTDYANFKAQVLAGEAQLQDADGNTMSADAAKAFVKTLP